MSSVGVYIKAGSRQDTLETSGTANLLAKMLTKGSQGVTKSQFAEEIENMGGSVSTSIDREITNVNVTCFKGDLGRALNLLGDAVANPNLDPAELELTKQEQADENDTMNKDQETSLLESCHFNSFRDHMLGQPIRGDRDNLQNLSVDDLRSFKAANYTGENMVVVGTGAIDHEAFVNQVAEMLGGITSSSGSQENSNKCVYTPSLLMMRDDEMYNANVGVFYDAPGVKDEDYYSFLLLKHMIGNYDIALHAAHLNNMSKQYNATHNLLGDLVDVTKQSCHYFAYSDCGLWGSYLFGNEVFVRQMNWVGLAAPTFYSDFVSEVEVVRARNNLWNGLMKQANAQEANVEIGRQMIQVGRRVTRSEIAKRVSNMDAHYMRGLCY